MVVSYLDQSLLSVSVANSRARRQSSQALSLSILGTNDLNNSFQKDTTFFESLAMTHLTILEKGISRNCYLPGSLDNSRLTAGISSFSTAELLKTITRCARR